MSVRIAVASTDGTYIDQHLGSARIFQIYDVAEKTYEPAGTRRTQAFCRGHCEGGFEHVLNVLKDCDAVFVNKVGEPAAAFMLQSGKRVFEASGSVEDVLDQIIAEHLLEEVGREA